MYAYMCLLCIGYRHDERGDATSVKKRGVMKGAMQGMMKGMIRGVTRDEYVSMVAPLVHWSYLYAFVTRYRG